jgi:hypothetical protein
MKLPRLMKQPEELAMYLDAALEALVDTVLDLLAGAILSWTAE